MSRPRFFVESPPSEGVVLLSERDTHHACDVLRMREGDRMVVVDPCGTEFVGRIECVDAGRARVVVSEGLPPRAATPHVTLFQCVGKGRKMDQVVRQSTELGVAAVVPVASERTVVRLEGE